MPAPAHGALVPIFCYSSASVPVAARFVSSLREHRRTHRNGKRTLLVVPLVSFVVTHALHYGGGAHLHIAGFEQPAECGAALR